MSYSFKRKAMVLTKVKGFTEFKHFSTYHNTPLTLSF